MACVSSTEWMHHMDADEASREKARLKWHKDIVLYWTNPGSNISWNSNCTATYLQSQKPSKLNEQGMWNTAEKTRKKSSEEHTYNRFEWTLVWTLCMDVDNETCWEQWKKSTTDERKSQGNLC